MNAQLAVVSLWAEDVPTTAHFYREVLGLKLMPHHGERPHFDLGGIYLAILRGKPRPAEAAHPPRFPIIAFAVADLEAAVTRLTAHSVALPWGIEEDSGARWVMFNDPAGNLIELAQFKGEARRAFESKGE